MTSPLKLKSVQIENVRAIKKVILDFEKEAGDGFRPMTIFIGENGSGKSSILRAIAIGLCPQSQASSLIAELSGSVIRKQKNGEFTAKASIKVSLSDPENPRQTFEIVTVIKRNTSGQELIEQTHTPEIFPWHRVFVCGYGVNRGSERYEPTSEYRQSDSVRSLFDRDAALLDPEGELRRLRLAGFEDGNKAQQFAQMCAILKKVLRLEGDQPIVVNSEEIQIRGPWAPTPFHALGDGYRGSASLILDLLGRFNRSNLEMMSGSPGGVVLIDELDEHLHPEWQKKVAGLLKNALPHMQFICTTHSPMTIVNSEADEVFACNLRDGAGSVAALPSPEGKNADDILKGEWFGLSSTFDDQSEKLLNRYLDAVKTQLPESERHGLEKKIRHRLGYLITTPLEEAALKIVQESRDELEDMSAEQRKMALRDAFEQW